jgi:xanthine dehydrogenase YagT iron-sulfur-binding subunit
MLRTQMPEATTPHPTLPRSRRRGAPDEIAATLTVKGVETQLKVARWTILLDGWRDNLDLTGTKKGCNHACTVTVDGRRINSCLTLPVVDDGAQACAIEGLTANDALNPLRQGLIDHNVYRTSGQICLAAAYLNILAATQQGMRRA